VISFETVVSGDVSGELALTAGVSPTGGGSPTTIDAAEFNRIGSRMNCSMQENTRRDFMERKLLLRNSMPCIVSG
jgi:hypothetical protein